MTTTNYYKNIDDACASFGFTGHEDVMTIINLMGKRHKKTFTMYGEEITITYNANYEGNKYYKVEITA